MALIAPRVTRRLALRGSRDLQRLLVYRYDGIKTCARGEAPDAPSVLAFDDVFTRQYDVVLAGGAHAIARDFCLLLRDGAFVLLASSAPAGCAPIQPSARLVGC